MPTYENRWPVSLRGSSLRDPTPRAENPAPVRQESDHDQASICAGMTTLVIALPSGEPSVHLATPVGPPCRSQDFGSSPPLFRGGTFGPRAEVRLWAKSRLDD